MMMMVMMSGGSRGGTLPPPLFWVKRKSQKEENPAGQAGQPLKYQVSFNDMDTAFWLCQRNLDSDSNYNWDTEYLTFIVDSKAQDSRFQEKISRIPDSLIWSGSDPKINTFSNKLNSVNWASTTTCRLSVHVVLVTKNELTHLPLLEA